MKKLIKLNEGFAIICDKLVDEKLNLYFVKKETKCKTFVSKQKTGGRK